MDSSGFTVAQKAEMAFSCAERGGWVVRVELGAPEFLDFPVLIRILPESNICYTNQVGGSLLMQHPDVRGYMVPLMPTKDAIRAFAKLRKVFRPEPADGFDNAWIRDHIEPINRALDGIQDGLRLDGGTIEVSTEAWLYVVQYGSPNLPCVLSWENSD